LQRQLISAFVGVLIVIFSVVLFFGREAQAPGSIDPGQPTNGPAGGSGGGSSGAGGGAAQGASSFGEPASSLTPLLFSGW
jgi:hypothetical protein